MFTSQNSAWAPSVWVLGVLEYLTKYMYIPVINPHNFSKTNSSKVISHFIYFVSLQAVQYNPTC